MSGYISEDKISEIKNSADIVDIVSEAVILKKSGKNYLGLCPFHPEKTPSFTVSPDKQIFHCFGCHEGGNVFTFLMKHQGLSFPEAVRILAQRYGISLPREKMTPDQEKAESERQQLLSVNSMAVAFFHDCLIRDRKGAAARAYVLKRGLTQDILVAFRLGYAPAGWDYLVNYLSGKKVPLRLAEQAGLLVEKQEGGYYDRFRNRIVFPITDVAGRVIAFGGRVMDDSLPKYLNSPETLIYNKRRVLYGLEAARQKCRETKTVYITEGYMDFLALYRHGIQNVVATLGTAMTVEHVRLLRGYVTKAVMVFDSDEAGLKAARRGIEIFKEEKNIKPFILSLPEGHDPDSYLMQHGAEQFERIAAGAQEAMVFLIDEAVKKHGLSVDGKLRVMSAMEGVLAAIDDDLARSLYIKELAERLGIEERAVLERVGKALAGLKNKAGAGEASGGEGVLPPVENNGHDFSGKDRMEKQMIEMMMQAPFMLGEIEQAGVLDYFENKALASVGRLLLRHHETILTGAADIPALAESLEQKQIITALLVGNELSAGDWDRTGCRKLVRQFEARCRCRQDNLTARIKTADDNHDDELFRQLLRSKRQQLEQKNKIHLNEC